MADVPIEVFVMWCGSTYPMQMAPTATIADLKRNISHIEGLPSKRQRFKDNTPKQNILADEMIVSALHNNTVHLVALCQKDDNYRQIFLGHSTNGLCYVTNNKDPLIDFDKKRVGMYKGVYEVVTTKMDCLLKAEDKRYTRSENLSSFQLMRTFRHPNSIAMENYYKSGPTHRLVLSNSVDGTVDGYVRKERADVFNFNDMTLTMFVSKMMTELCDVLDKLIAKGICPKSLSTCNLYLKMVKDVPQLKVLFNSVEPLATADNEKARQLAKLCGDIQGIFDTYVKPEYAVNDETICFRRFLGEGAANYIGKNLGMVVKSYPHNWNDDKKASYLVDLISSNTDLRYFINSCGITWPKNELGDDISEELQRLKKSFEDENVRIQEMKASLRKAGRSNEANKLREFIWNYKTEFPYDLVRHGRNLWKHYDTYPPDIKSLLGSKRGALRALERWCPGVWCLIYNAVALACKWLFLLLLCVLSQSYTDMS